jgi:hypothetical protein
MKIPDLFCNIFFWLFLRWIMLSWQLSIEVTDERGGSIFGVYLSSLVRLFLNRRLFFFLRSNVRKLKSSLIEIVRTCRNIWFRRGVTMLEQFFVAAFVTIGQPLPSLLEIFFIPNNFLYWCLWKQLSFYVPKPTVLLNAGGLIWIVYFRLFHLFIVDIFASSLLELLSLEKLRKAHGTIFLHTFLCPRKYFSTHRIRSRGRTASHCFIKNRFSFLS